MEDKPTYSDRIYKDCQDLTSAEKADLISKLAKFEQDSWFQLSYTDSITSRDHEMKIVTNIYLTPEDIVVKSIKEYIPEKDGFSGNLHGISINMHSYKTPVEDVKKTLMRIIESE
ncbi:hypothetical protein HOE04_04905 [archaeon]|jgi:hypothetical protein|nr:hypothetical protein [archaeon]